MSGWLIHRPALIDKYWWDYFSQSISAASSSSSSGSDVVSIRNYLYNPSFAIIQRGAGPYAAASATFTVDRWCVTRGGTAGVTVSRQTGGPRYKMRVQRDNGNTSTAVISFYQALDSARSAEFAGQTATLSFYASSGANYSAASGVLQSIIAFGTGTDQAASGAPGGTWTGISSASQTNTLSSTRSLFSQSFALSSSTSQIAISFKMTPVGTAGAADYFEIDSPKLELGSVASVYTGNPDVDEFADCAMFYEDMARGALTGVPTLRVISTGFANTAGGSSGTAQYFAAGVPIKTKRNNAHTLTVGSTSSWHVTAAGLGSYYSLVLGTLDASDAWSHTTLEDGLLQFHYTINGTNPALANYQAVLVALDGASDSKFAVDCELAP
jgi:hypothetical protein